MDTLKMLAIMAIVSIVAILFGRLFLGPIGTGIFFVISILIHILVYFFSGHIALHMAHAKPFPIEKEPEVKALLDEVATKAGIPSPKLFLCPDPQPNAFAVGYHQKTSAIAITKGLVELMKPAELKGVLAHEISRIKRGDTLLASYTAAAAGLITIFSQIGKSSVLGETTREKKQGNSITSLILLICTPIASLIVKFCIDPQRRYLADFQGATFTREPLALATSLKKMQLAVEQGIPLLAPNPSLAHLYTINPFNKASLSNLFSVHPNILERISKLEGMTV